MPFQKMLKCCGIMQLRHRISCTSSFSTGYCASDEIHCKHEMYVNLMGSHAFGRNYTNIREHTNTTFARSESSECERFHYIKFQVSALCMSCVQSILLVSLKVFIVVSGECGWPIVYFIFYLRTWSALKFSLITCTVRNIIFPFSSLPISVYTLAHWWLQYLFSLHQCETEGCSANNEMSAISGRLCAIGFGISLHVGRGIVSSAVARSLSLSTICFPPFSHIQSFLLFYVQRRTLMFPLNFSCSHWPLFILHLCNDIFTWISWCFLPRFFFFFLFSCQAIRLNT